MSVKDNFASFIDEETDLAVFVESRDNREFEVRIGRKDDAKLVGFIQASSDDELNRKIEGLFRLHQLNG